MNTTKKPRILAIGEVLWDIIRGQEHIGGAPFNLAAHLSRLGCQVSILTRIGADPRGGAAVKEMKRLGVDVSLVQVDARHPTGWAMVELTGDGVPNFSFPDDPAYNFIEADDHLLCRLADVPFDAICFGTLAQNGDRTHRSLMRVLQSVPATHVLYDVNIRLDFYPQDILHESLAFSTVVKLNADEAQRMAQRLYGSAMPEVELASRLSADFPVRVVCVTKGADGCAVYAGGTARNFTCEPTKVADTVGAGDAFSAAFLQHYCRTGDCFASAQRGNLLGAYVASRPGAVPEYEDSIRECLSMSHGATWKMPVNHARMLFL
jgi:fructokinase